MSELYLTSRAVIHLHEDPVFIAPPPDQSGGVLVELHGIVCLYRCFECGEDFQRPSRRDMALRNPFIENAQGVQKVFPGKIKTFRVVGT